MPIPHPEAYTAAELTSEARRIAAILGPGARVYLQVNNEGPSATMWFDFAKARDHVSARGVDFPSLLADAERVAMESAAKMRVET